MLGPGIEWVHVEPGTVVVATTDRSWVHKPQPWNNVDPFDLPMGEPGTLETTRRLLEGCIGAGQAAVQTNQARPPVSLVRWVWRLAGYYHTTHATPRLMRVAAERFAAMGRPQLAEYAALKADDEGGHDLLSQRDLVSLGFDAAAVVEALVPPTAATLVEYFTSLVYADDPIGCVGYAYALERLAVAVPKDYLVQVEAVLPRGVNATRCLRVHSASGTDLQHVEDAVRVTASLPAADRIRIAQACYQTTKICASAPPEGHLPERELEQRLSLLSPAARRPHPHARS